MPRPSLSLSIDPETMKEQTAGPDSETPGAQPGVKAERVNKLDSDALSIASSVDSPKPKVVQRLHSQVEESRDSSELDGGEGGEGGDVGGVDDGESDPEEINSEDEDEDEDEEGVGLKKEPPSAIKTQISSDNVGMLLFTPGGQHAMATTQKKSPKPPQNHEGEGEESGKGRALSINESLFDQSLKNRIFKIGVRIGKGASASVFRAIDSITLKVVALKEISISEPLKCKMLQEELKALVPQRRSLDDDENGTNCIVDYYGAWVDMTTKTAYMVMEYMSDGSFEGLVDLLFKAKEGDESMKELYSKWSAGVGKDLFTGLNNFHETNRVHRDIKPANILINGKGEAKLSDFGLARSVEASVDAKATSFVGTFNFMSPERLYGNNYTKTSDIWSAGMTLFYACRGKYPLTEGLGFWELVSELEEIVAKINEDEDLSEVEKGFFSSCFQGVETRPSASVLLKDPLLSSDFVELSAEERRKISAIVKKAKQENLVLHLTTDDVNDFALAVIRARAGEIGGKLGGGNAVPSKDEMLLLSRRLGVFSITVEDSFEMAKGKYENELSTYELRGIEASKVKVVTRSERRRRRTFGANARVRGVEEADFDEVSLAMNVASSALDSFVEGNEAILEGVGEELGGVDFKTRAHHAKSAPEQPKATILTDDVTEITKQFNDMSKLIESEIGGGGGLGGEEGGEVKMISVGEARRRRRRRTFDGKRPRPDQLQEKHREIQEKVGGGESVMVKSELDKRVAGGGGVSIKLPEIDGGVGVAGEGPPPPIFRRARTSERGEGGVEGEEDEKDNVKLRTKSMTDMLGS